jgi:hypothetical protein
MDPYQFSVQQGQVIGDEPVTVVDDGYEPEDLMDLILYRYARDGHLNRPAGSEQEAVAQFAAYANRFLERNRVASTGLVDGAFALVFEDGSSVPLSSSPEPARPARPEVVVPITTPRTGKMKGMPMRDDSVPITQGGRRKS